MAKKDPADSKVTDPLPPINGNDPFSILMIPYLNDVHVEDVDLHGTCQYVDEREDHREHGHVKLVEQITESRKI